MTTVAIVGARGYVGAELVRAFARLGAVEVISVTREDYQISRAREYDLVVNAAMPSGRFWARENPLDDFRESVQKTADLFYGWTFRHFVQISSVSARCQLDTVYGRHKAAAENVCQGPNTLVVRLGAMYSDDLKKGVLIDILQQRPLFVSGESRYCFAPLSFVGNWVARNWRRAGTIEVGARDSIRLGDLPEKLGKEAHFSGAVDHQEVLNPEPDFPAAADVVSFLRERMTKGY